ncbi:MAG: peptidase [Desulfitobacterium sp.]|nr:peptidase [Desulfitobacterium sp.]
MMKLVAQLEEFLHDRKANPASPDLAIRDWRIVVQEAQQISLGIKENSPGTVYTPPSYRKGEKAELYIIWEDGRLTQAQVQAPPQGSGKEYWFEQLTEWRQGSYEDPYGADIPEPEALPVVAVEDREIARILQGEDEVFFEQLARLLKNTPEGVNLNASIQGNWGYIHVRNSRGLAISYQQSQYGISFSFDSLVGAGFGKRRLIKPEEWDFLWNRTCSYYEALQKEGPEVGEETLIVMTPSVTGDFMRQFLHPNLVGQNILEGRSAFKKEDFHGKNKVFHENISLVVDPLRPFELSSYLVTGEGVPARQTVLVDKGTLQSPILRMKDAKRWGEPPTGVPAGSSGMYLQGAQEEPWENVLREIKDGILILSVLGMHTQNSASGDYSLSAPQSLRILDGKIIGKRDVKIQGNFFKDLASEKTRLGTTEIDSKPYLVIQGEVQNM